MPIVDLKHFIISIIALSIIRYSCSIGNEKSRVDRYWLIIRCLESRIVARYFWLIINYNWLICLMALLWIETRKLRGVLVNFIVNVWILTCELWRIILYEFLLDKFPDMWKGILVLVVRISISWIRVLGLGNWFKRLMSIVLCSSLGLIDKGFWIWFGLIFSL
jgi:hypothetical protein